MNITRRAFDILAVLSCWLLMLSPAVAAGPGCSWAPGFTSQSPDSPVRAMAIFDDGGGAALYVGGEFIDVAGQTVNHIAKWDGSTWSALGTGTDDPVNALTVFDDGSGPALFVGGEFVTAGGVTVNRIGKWDGSTWSAVGTGMSTTVNTLATFNDGSGGGLALYAAGRFGMAGGSPATRIAKWDGSNWSALGAGLANTVESLTVFDDGGGAALYAGGWFTSAGGSSANRVAKWDGSAWSAVGTGTNDAVESLVVYDDGGGADLYAGGRFTTAGGSTANRLARWDGTQWSSLGMGVNSVVSTLTVFDDGTGSKLYAGGWFTFADDVLSLRIAGWDGSAWSGLGSGMNNNVDALLGYDDGTGPVLYAGGKFTSAGETGATHLAQWDFASWSTLSTAGGGLNELVRSFAVFDDGAGPDLYAGGDFTGAGSMLASRVARWDGQAWSVLGDGLFNDVQSLQVYNDGTGPALYAVTRSELWKWDGAAWTVVWDFLGVGLTLSVFDDGTGPKLYVAGELRDISQELVDLYVGIWDGTTWSQSFYSLETDGGEPEDEIFSLAIFDPGNGPKLYGGGRFPDTENVIQQDSRDHWSDAGTGLDGLNHEGVHALQVFDDGSGSSLFAGGSFTTEVSAANFMAELVDGDWTALTAQPNGTIRSLAYFDDGDSDDGDSDDGESGAGEGQGLYAAGDFTEVGALAANRIARWNGTAWAALGSGTDGSVEALGAFNDGAGTALYAGGSFVNAGGVSSAHIAKWDCPSAPAPNLGVTLSNGVDEVFAGDAVTYTIEVNHSGPVDIPAAQLVDTFAPELDCSWTSFGMNGASGYSNGSGPSITDTLVMPVAGSVSYTVACRLAEDATGTLTHSVTVTAPLDGNSSDDSAIDMDAIIENVLLFSDGFEGGDCSRWSTCP